MPRIYCTVSIYGETGAELNKFLSAHKQQYPAAVGFIDAAVKEKIARETIERDIVSQDTLEGL